MRKVENHYKETPETLHICDLTRSFFETATKENLRANQGKYKYDRKTVDKLLTFNYWSNQTEKYIVTIKMFLQT